MFGSILTVFGTLFFSDFLESDTIQDWVVSKWKTETTEDGTWKLDSTIVDDKKYNFLQTEGDSKFHTISKSFKPFTNKERNISFYYVTANKKNIECGGNYMKLFPSNTEQETLKGGENEDKYNIMFGPDLCGSTRKVHLILSHRGKNLENKKTITYNYGTDYNMYGFTLFTDESYSISLNNETIASGLIKDDYPLPTKLMDDPMDTKPEDWVDEELIDDPEDKKPDWWDSVTEQIPDPDATVPEDWDEEDDGEWEPPLINNPEYKGVWESKKIENPDYKGRWSPRKIENPEYIENDVVAVYNDFGILAFELWQVVAGSHFGMFLITDDVKEEDLYKINVMKFIDKEKEYSLKKAKEEQEEADKKAKEEADKKGDGEEEGDGNKGDDEDDEDDEDEEEKDEL